MALTPVEFPTPGGLNLLDDPQQIGGAGAVDLLNVDLGAPGRITTRGGYTDFTTSAAADRYKSLARFEASDGTIFLFASRPTGVDLVATTGAVSFTKATVSTAYAGHTFTRYGTPTSERMYFLSFNDSLRFWETGGTFGTATGTPPSGYIVSATPVDNRLVVGAAISGGTSYLSRVYFSGAGNPDSWGANDFVDLTPGDGEIISGIVPWRELLFVFKKTKFFVFYGNSTDPSGNPVFNYRAINTGVGTTSHFAIAAADDGLYFVNDRGVFVTAGGEPRKISGALDPFFQATAGSAWQSGTPSSTRNYSLTWAMDRLLCSVDTSAGRRTFVLQNGQWSVWDLPCAHISSIPISGIESLMFSYNAGSNKVGKLSTSATTDAGTAIVSRYRTGFWNPGQPAAESVVREWLIDGSGTVNVKTAVNDGSLGAASSVVLGTAPAIAQGRDRRSVRGRNVSVEISATSGAWTVSRVVANLRGQRNVGLKAT